jgi:hypothetical protein
MSPYKGIEVEGVDRECGRRRSEVKTAEDKVVTDNPASWESKTRRLGSAVHTSRYVSDVEEGW